ncbi:MAG: hypothetical protein JW987_11645 [Anaerolineaceae bacterium]|nr:hypothetical protein [Anaerolineaceae bacterium]
MTPNPKPRLKRILLWILLTPLLLCLAGGLVSYLINRGLPTQSAQVEVLSPAAVAHVREAQQLKSGLGDEVWPGFGNAGIPLMIYNERYAFLCGIEQAPAGWERAEGQPCFRGTYSNPQAFTHEIGGRWFGSMTTQEYMGIRMRDEISEQLPGPLAAVFPYGLITHTLGTERYLGALVHESFHAFQAEMARARFDDAERAYPDGDAYWANDSSAREQWKRETQALYDALNAQDEAEMRRYAAEFLIIRAERRSQTLKDESLALYEKRYEWLEGMAKYVELNTLLAAAHTPNYAPDAALAKDKNFHDYSQIDALWKSELNQMRRQAGLEGDTRFYYTGMAQGELLDRLMPDWKSRLFAEGVWLEDLLAEVLR